MKPLAKALLFDVALALCTFIFTLTAAAADFPAPPSVAPVNPAFIKFLHKKEPDKKGSVVQVSPSSAGPPPVVRSFGYFPSPVNFSHLKNSTGKFRAYGTAPSSFDLRTLGKVTPVRDQGSCGSCWAFAGMGSSESNLLTGESWDFSENNLKNRAGFDWGACTGGNELMTTAYLARWSGPVRESDDTYDPGSSVSPAALPVQKHYQEVIFLPARSGPTDNDAIKQALVDHGAVTTYYFHDFADAYYKPASFGYYYTGAERSSNHAVTIVGWDDNFSSSNFVTAPPGDGAFLIKNSWGTDWGNNGYFYISYYDPNLGTQNDFESSEANYVFVTPAAPDQYNHVYQYDTLGFTAAFGYGSETSWFANVFTAAGSDKLSAVSFYAVTTNASYEVYVYTGVGAQPTSGTLRGSTTGSLTQAGYHTITLPSPVQLTSGEKFAVVVKLTTPGYTFPVPAEYPVTGYATPDAHPGESFISQSGANWSDAISINGSTNVCLKAFTTRGDTATPPSITATAPADRALNVPVTSSISATFGAPMDAATITTSSFIVNGVAGEVSYDPATYSATFTPEVPLAENTIYAVTITSAVQDAQGNAMDGDTTWSFTTVRAANGLSFDELPGDDSRVPNGYGGLNWNNLFDTDPILRGLASGYVNGTVSPPNVAYNGWGTVANVFSRIPFTFYGAYLGAAFSDGVTIQVQGYRNDTLMFDKSIVAHTSGASYFRFGFAEVDRLMFAPPGGSNPSSTQFVLDNLYINYGPPDVASTVPASNATDVSVLISPITATFSEAMDPESITSSTFTLSNGVTGTVSYDAELNSASFLPSAPLAPNTKYTATVSTGARSQGGAPLPADYAWSFTTGPSYSVSGTVRIGSSTGQVLAGAAVGIGARVATTGSSGTFTVTSLPRGTYTMTIAKPGFVTYSSTSYSVTGNQSGLNFWLAPALSVSGKVHSWNVTGPALEGATASVSGGKLSAAVSAITAQDGSFILAGIPAGTYTLTIAKDGFVRYVNSAYTISVSVNGVNFGLIPVTYSVSGTVHSDSVNGPALASASLSLSGAGLLSPVTVYTGTTGAFTMGSIPAGSYTLTLSKTHYLTSSTPYTVTGSQSGVQLYLVPAYTMSGYVRSGSGSGPVISGADVYLGTTKVATTNSYGFFTSTAVTAGSYPLTIHKDGYSDYLNETYSISADQSNLSFVMTPIPQPNLAPYMPPGWSDKVVVAKGLDVTYNTGTQFYSSDDLYVAWSAINNGTAATTSKFNTRVLVDGVSMGLWLNDLLTTNSYTYGLNTSIGKLSAGTHTITVLIDDGNQVAESNESDNSSTKTITVLPPPTYTVSGTVRSGSLTGPIVSGATVTLGTKTATTGSTGSFALSGVLAGTYQLSIAKTGYLSYSNDAYLVAGSQSGNYALSLAPTPNLAPAQPQGWSDKVVVGKASGVISNTSSVFYTTDSLYIACAVTNNGTANVTLPFSTSVYVDDIKRGYWNTVSLAMNASASGETPIGTLPAGVHTVKMVIDEANGVAESSELDNSYSKTITVAYPPTYTISGTVRSGSLTGAALAGATVTLGTRSTLTSSTGYFSFTGVAAGSYPLTISKTGYTSYSNDSYAVGGVQSGNYVLQKLQAGLKLELTPNPAEGGEVWQFSLALTETKGVGLKINSILWEFFDANNNILGRQSSDASYFANWFGAGSSSMAALGTAGGSVWVSLGGRTSGSVVITFSGTDDYGNAVTVSGRESLTALLPAQSKPTGATAPLSPGRPRVWK